MENQNRWQIKVQKDGERRAFYSSKPGRTGQRECNKKADDWLDDGIDGTNIRVSKLFDEYIEELKITTSQSNWKQVQTIWKNWIKPAIGSKKIGKVNEQDLQKIINNACAKKLSKKTLLNILNAEKAFIKYCRKRKCSTLFPENVTVPKSAKYKRKQILQPSDIIKLFNCTNSTYRGKVVFDDYIYAYRFQVLTGLRPGELLGLKWSDIKEGRVNIGRAINRFGEITAGKNDNAIRSFALNQMALDVIEAQKQVNPPTPTGYVFDITTQEGYLKRWYRFCEYNDITKITPYEMRHTFVSVTKSLPEGQLRPLVGHSKDMDTFGVYSHEIEGDSLNTAKEVEKIFKNILNPDSATDDG